MTKDRKVIGTGYNGAESGEPHCPETAEHLALDHCTQARHAEINALRNALLPPFGATLYVVGPRPVCVNCADRLREAGVSTIKWRREVLTLDTLAADIRAWQAETFPHATPASTAEHLRREAEELAAHPLSSEEIADVFHLLVAVAEAGGYDLVDVTARKLAINRERMWQAPDGMGVSEHVREVAS